MGALQIALWSLVRILQAFFASIAVQPVNISGVVLDDRIYIPSLQQEHVQAKPETVDKGREIAKKQWDWALSTDAPDTGASKFAALGADSLDTALLGIFIATSESVFCFVLLLTSSSGQVEVVMGLEEEFGIGVGERASLPF
ncbi:hypothetical protein Peur_004931 [Populus x canadensis]